MTTTNCKGCGWTGYSHRHNDAEDGPRADCCDHTCSVVIDDTPNDDGPGRDTTGAPVDDDVLRWRRSYGIADDGFCGNCGAPLRRLAGYLVHEVTADGIPNSAHCDATSGRLAVLA